MSESEEAEERKSDGKRGKKKQKNTFEIENFAVETSFPGQGFGQQMMKQLITYLKENLAADELILGTDDISGNVEFYEKCGFEITHIISNYFVFFFCNIFYKTCTYVW